VTTPTALDDALRRLFLRATHGIRPGTARVAALLEAMGRPERTWACIHVAGTNGKGSVCAMIEAILRAAGIRTGLYTSPHLVRFHERIRVDGAAVGDADLAACLDTVETAAQALDRGGAGEATFFEIGTAAAFEHFRRTGVQVAVVETGLGGRWDATNVVLPLVAVVTEIDLDHCECLGRTVAEVAAEKAGIVKPGRPVVCGASHPEAMRVIADAAAAAGAPLIRAADEVTVRRRPEGLDGQRLSIATGQRQLRVVRLPLLGAHQAVNAAVAVAAVEAFAGAVADPGDEAFAHGLETVVWPGRLQVLRRDPVVVLDGAHNPHGARALARALDELRGRHPVGLVAGVLADKDREGFFRALAGSVARCWTVPVHCERASDPAELAGLARAAGIVAAPADALRTALDAALEWARASDGWVCVAGSLYLAGEVLDPRGSCVSAIESAMLGP
jgi:dihydrofolate synthase/folylpolyglutamate synthase